MIIIILVLIFIPIFFAIGFIFWQENQKKIARSFFFMGAICFGLIVVILLLFKIKDKG